MAGVTRPAYEGLSARPRPRSRTGRRGYRGRVRAVVVVNPAATSTTPRALEVVLGALAHGIAAEVLTTGHRGHATELARKARTDGHDVVVSVGGDGTLNEVVNGLLADGTGPDVPTLGIVPGGSTNVFARNLGVPRDPVEATGALLSALRSGRRRRVGLGRADERWFTFCAGLGLDAAVVREVEHRRGRGATSTAGVYVRAAVSQFYDTDRRHGPITLKLPGREPVRGLFVALVTNAAPWTYWGGRAVNPSPDASFDTGLDVMGLTRLRTMGTLRNAAQLLRSERGRPTGRHVLDVHDAASLVLTAEPAAPYQLDGDYLGERSAVRLSAVPRALTVLA